MAEFFRTPVLLAPLLAPLLASVAAAVALLAAAPADAGLFNPETFTLENGMEVVVIPDHRAPVVTHMVWYKVGAADEAPGESGVAHFLEHLMFRGTDRLSDGEFSRIIARNGGRDNAFTSYDYTGYYQTVAVDKLDLMMGLEADRMVNLKIDDAVVATERKVLVEERAQRTDSRPSALLGERMTASQFLAYPYRLPVIGWRHEIEALERPAVEAFYRRYYAPNNAILVVAGDVTAASVRPMAEKHYGPLARQPVPPRARAQEPPQLAARRVEMVHARVVEPSWRRSYLAPSRNTGSAAGSVALRMLADILGGGSTGRLYRQLVVEQGIATSASALYHGLTLGPTRFWLFAQPRPGGDLGQVEAALDAVLAALLADGVSARELARAKNDALADAIYARDGLSTAARIFGVGLTSGLTVAEIEAWPELVAAVTVEQVNQAAREVLVLERSVTGTLRPKPAS